MCLRGCISALSKVHFHFCDGSINAEKFTEISQLPGLYIDTGSQLGLKEWINFMIKIASYESMLTRKTKKDGSRRPVWGSFWNYIKLNVNND